MWTDIVKWASGDPVLARKLRAMVREIRASRQWRVTGNCYFKQTAGGNALHILGGDDTTVRPFYLKTLSGVTATIGAGLILHGNNAPVEIDETEVTITGGTIAAPHYVILEYNYSTLAGEIYTTSFSALPTSEPPDIYRCALHSFYRSGASAVHLMPHRSSDIDVPGWAFRA